MVSTNQICNTWGVCGSSTIISGQKRMLEKGATFHPFILLFPTKIKLQIWEVRTLHHLCRKSTKSVRPSHTKVFHEPTILKKNANIWIILISWWEASSEPLVLTTGNLTFASGPSGPATPLRRPAASQASWRGWWGCIWWNRITRTCCKTQPAQKPIDHHQMYVVVV